MFERSWTVINPANAGAAVVALPDFALPDGEVKLELEAWGGGLVGSNAYIFEGNVLLGDAAQRVLGSGRVDCLLLVPRGGRGCVCVDSDLEKRLTVFFDTNFASPQAVQIRLRQVS